MVGSAGNAPVVIFQRCFVTAGLQTAGWITSHTHAPRSARRRTDRPSRTARSSAANRWRATHAERYTTGNDTLLGDDFCAHQPFGRQVLLHNLPGSKR